jgi:hypothetical protein
MPGFDGRGSAGAGPMTGGARGWCAPYGVRYGAAYGFPRAAYPANGPYRPPFGFARPRFGLGWGGRGGWARVRGRGRW